MAATGKQNNLEEKKKKKEKGFKINIDPSLFFLFFTTIKQNIMKKPNFSFYHEKVIL